MEERDVTLEDVVRLLAQETRLPNGSHKAKCPFHHESKTLSLQVGPGGGWFCHGACGRGGNLKELYERLLNPPPGYYTERVKSVRHGRNRGGREPDRVVAATYNYQDERGKTLFRVVRYHPKGFCVQAAIYKDGKFFGWASSLKGVRRVLYHLPEILARPDEVVLLTEGEKDADALVELGFLATTCPMGASAWNSSYARSLRGRRVVILPDNDSAGRSHALRVQRDLEQNECSVTTLLLDGLEEGGDVSDWIAAGGTKEALRCLIRNCQP